MATRRGVEVRRFSQKLAVDLNLTARQTVERILILAVRFAKDECPVLTGALRRNVKYEMDSDPRQAAGVFGNGLAYAPWVNLGTRRMRANPYLMRALARVLAFGEEYVSRG